MPYFVNDQGYRFWEPEGTWECEENRKHFNEVTHVEPTQQDELYIETCTEMDNLLGSVVPDSSGVLFEYSSTSLETDDDIPF